ncbi:AMP-binding protein [Acidovorax sp.]|uniref:AMP-binding protein n=1 Tax=Acidovorax sp. TaxID=1872122 RepID=UPI00263A2D86|nr:AMP-binding protein [Acidovorax sp.]
MAAPALNPPFARSSTIRSLQDIERLERQPLALAQPVQSTYEIFRNAAHAFRNKTALTFLPTADLDDTTTEPVRWSYAQLLAGIHQTANLLHALGMGPRDAVAVLLPGCLEYHLALWGGEAAGIVQPLNPMLSDEKLAAMMNLAHTKVLIAYGTGCTDDTGGTESGGGLWAKALRLLSQVPTLSTVLRVAPHGEVPGAAGVLPEGVVDFAARLRQPADRLVSGRRIAATDIAAYFHTGGTTGAPKLARHSHGAQVFTAWASVQMQGTTSQDVWINGYPLFHVAGVLPGSLAALSAGVETIIPTTDLFRNRAVIDNYWRLVERHRCTSLSAVPTVLAALASVPLDGADISSLRHCRTGAAILAPELAARFERLFGLHLHESLGMTEMAGISTITPPGVRAPVGCVGWRMPYAQLRIVALDAQGELSDTDALPGQPGMVLFQSPNLFSGFLDTADTAPAFTPDGWLITGDLGFVDAEGRLHLSGRAKDLIIRSGHNIDPRVIEDALGAHPAVQLCAAVGAPDAYAGELPVAFATLLPGTTASEAELMDFTAARVDEPVARPRWVRVLDALPMTNVGKIYKPALRQQAACHTVAARVAAARADLGTTCHSEVLPDGDNGVRVLLSGADNPAQTQALLALKERLDAVLAPLPIRTTVQVVAVMVTSAS